MGDIHGEIAKLRRALDLIRKDGGAEARIVFVGDFADRGPDTRAVLDRLIEGRAAGLPWHFLKGNHDRLFRNFLIEGVDTDEAMVSGLSWLNPRLGGDKTLASYGLEGVPEIARPRSGRPERLVHFSTPDEKLRIRDLVAAARERVPAEHVDFLEDLPLTYRDEGLFFCHAGIRPGVPLDEQVEDDLIWIRRPFHDSTADHGALIVHGHTPIDYPRHFGNRVDIDSGAAFGKPLVPVVFEGDKAFALDEDGRRPLNPDE